jgi:hypothetical protein
VSYHPSATGFGFVMCVATDVMCVATEPAGGYGAVTGLRGALQLRGPAARPRARQRRARDARDVAGRLRHLFWFFFFLARPFQASFYAARKTTTSEYPRSLLGGEHDTSRGRVYVFCL